MVEVPCDAILLQLGFKTALGPLKEWGFEIEKGAIRTMDLRQIKTDPQDFGLMTYDPAFLNTASCKSRITFIDGDRGILRYRGYPIEQIAEDASFLETAYLLIEGELPSGRYRSTDLATTLATPRTAKMFCVTCETGRRSGRSRPVSVSLNVS